MPAKEGSPDRRCYRVLDALVRCSGEFDHAVDMILLRNAILLVSLASKGV
jgi:hypothetical protein